MTFHAVVLFLIVLYHCGYKTQSSLAVDWTVFEEKMSIDKYKSISLIKSLSIVHYWDVLKGAYRTGILGESIKDSNPALVSHLEKKVTMNNEQNKINTLVVDQATVFMHGMATIKFLSEVVDGLQQYLTEYQVKKHSSLLDKENETIFLTSKSDLATYKRVLSITINTLDILIEARQALLTSKFSGFDYYASESRQSRETMHDNLLNHTSVHHAAVFGLSRERIQSLVAVYEEGEASALSSERSLLEDEFSSELAQLLSQEAVRSQADSFRAQGEQAAAKQAHASELHILRARSLAQQESAAQLMDSVLEELVTQGTLLVQDPWSLLLSSRYLVLALGLIALALEVSGAVKVLLRSAMSSAKPPVVSQPLRTTLSKSKHKSDISADHFIDGSMVLDTAAASVGFSYVQSLRVAVSRGTCLPNALLHGAAGCGKSLLSQLVVSSLSPALSTTVVQAGDLLALGTQAGHLLRNLLSGSAAPHLVVLEDADFIISARSSSRGESASDSADAVGLCCMFTLMECLRESSPHHCVLMTSRLAVSAIDTAVLDRLDYLVPLSLPQPLERLQFVLAEFDRTLRCLLKPEDVEQFSELIATTSTSQILNKFCCVSSQQLQQQQQILPSPISDVSVRNTGCSPETDRPSSSSLLTEEDLLVGWSERRREFRPDSFQSVLCLQLLVEISQGWSFRDLGKAMSGIRFDVSATDSCVLTSNIWFKETMFRANSSI